MTLCEENCNFTGYDTENKKAICSCEVKIKLPLLSEITFDKNKLYQSFSNLNNIANMKVMKCYSLLFSKEGIFNNIGCYILIPIIILHFICIIVFYLNDYKIIKKKIIEIIFAKKSLKSLNDNKIIPNDGKENIKKINSNKKGNEIIKSKKKLLFSKKKFFSSKLISIYDKNNKCNKNEKNKDDKIEDDKNWENENKDDKKDENKEEGENNKNNKNESNKTIQKVEKPLFLKYLKRKGIMNKMLKKNDGKFENNKNSPQNPPIKNSDKYKKNSKNKKYAINTLQTSSINQKFNDKSNNAILNNNNDEKNNKIDIKIIQSIMRYNIYEVNALIYEDAIKYDNRTYIQYYFSLLKTHHLFAFSFCPLNDYNSRIVKIYLFFFSFAIYFAVNALFFSDSTMHKIYKDEGSFNFIYQIPQILYSSLISAVLNVILRTLALTERNVLYIKNEKNIEKLYIIAKEMIRFIFYKLMLFFIITFILLLFIWYYLSCFCAVYKNTQIHLIKDSIISFGLSMLYPLGIYLLPGIFRIPSLKAIKKDKKGMYQFSRFLQMI